MNYDSPNSDNTTTFAQTNKNWWLEGYDKINVWDKYLLIQNGELLDYPGTHINEDLIVKIIKRKEIERNLEKYSIYLI